MTVTRFILLPRIIILPDDYQV